MNKNQVIQRDAKGKILPGSILNPYGKPPSVLSYGGRANREMREFLISKFYEKIGENWEMIYKNIMELCAEKNQKALFDLLSYMVPRLKEKDTDINPIFEAVSTDELKREMKNQIAEMSHFVEQMREQSKISDQNNVKPKNLVTKNNKNKK